MDTSASGVHRRPESNSAPGPAHSMAATFKNLSTGAFHYKALLTSRRRSTVAGEASSLESGLEDDHHQAHCSCVPFLGWRAKQLLGARGHVSTEVSATLSGLEGAEVKETPSSASFFFRLLAYYGRLRENMRDTNVNVYDLLVGNQMLCFLTASPIIQKTKALSSASRRRRPATDPTSSFSRNSSDVTPVQTMNAGRVESNADRRLFFVRR